MSHIYIYFIIFINIIIITFSTCTWLILRGDTTCTVVLKARRRTAEIRVHLRSFQTRVTISDECQAMHKWSDRWTFENFHYGWIISHPSKPFHFAERLFNGCPRAIYHTIAALLSDCGIFVTTRDFAVLRKNQISTRTKPLTEMWRCQIK